ncbi:pectate lyase [Acidobacteria bacterium AH-259-G07]|nr:pectate lyase [Acidobacteria bacterium AH-259-G07]
MAVFVVHSALATWAAPTRKEVLAAMKTATDFMMNTVSTRGGFVQKYSLDLKEKYGELKARDSMIWVEPPGTPTVGLMLIEAHRTTNDAQYLEYADRVAGALIWGQLPSGGWHYFIDFDMEGVQKYYDEFLSQSWGWEEYYHYYGNGTFDDDTTASATRFLLRLYATTLDPKYKSPLLKALDFTLDAQYPNGAWPQRYPLSREFRHHGHPDYTSFYTFNDGVISNNVGALVEAYEKLGDKKYWEAARRGMDFYILSQLPSPQTGWAQQYGFDMKPAWARSQEMNAVSSGQTFQNVRDLMNFYRVTGDRRYLEPIPKAIRWLETARIPETNRPGGYTQFYELGSNRPVYQRREGTPPDFLWVKTYDAAGVYPLGVRFELDVSGLEREFQQVRSLSPLQARSEYERSRTYTHPRIQRPDPLADYRVLARDADEIRQLIESLDERGGWVVETQMSDREDFINNPPHRFKAYDTGTYVTRMYRLINYLNSLKP